MPTGIYKRTKLHSNVQIDKNCGSNNGMWKGDKAGYYAIHSWLILHYGKANMCTNTNCDGVSNVYHWAKLLGFKYERKRDNFVMMCAKCHRKYDYTPESTKRSMETMKKNGNHFAGWNRGKKMSKGHYDKLREIALNRNFSDETKKKMSESSKKAWARRKLCQSVQ